MTHAVAGTVTAVAPLVVAAALVVSGLVLASARSPATALAVLLDLLLAAGLLRLSADAAPGAIASAALVVVIRKVAGLGLAAGRRRQARPTPLIAKE
jgi:hypothetical protein